MEPYRERIEDFMRRYGYEGDRVLWVLALPALVGTILVVMVRLSLGPAGTQTSFKRNDFVRACGRKFFTPLADDRSFVRLMRKDCGIYGPQAAGTSGD